MKDKYSDIVKKLRAKGYFVKDKMYGVEPSDASGMIKLYNADKEEWTMQSYLTIVLYNIIVDDVFYMNRMLKDFPSIYFTINRKVIDDTDSVVFINKKFDINEKEAFEALEYWVKGLPPLDKDIRKYIDSLGYKYEDEDINL
jgi:hypothetical protein